MPYAWTTLAAPERSGAVPVPEGARAALRLWPHRSLPPGGFVFFIGATAVLMALPLLAFLGLTAMWWLLAFLLAALAAMWAALSASYRSGEVEEVLLLWPDRVTLTRRDPRRPERSWEANPHWVRAEFARGPVPSYLTLRGAGRVVEIGAFLSEDERVALKPEIEQALAGLGPRP